MEDFSFVLPDLLKFDKEHLYIEIQCDGDARSEVDGCCVQWHVSLAFPGYRLGR